MSDSPKLPLPFKILCSSMAAMAIIWALIITPIKEANNRKNFYSKSFGSVVIDVSRTSGGKFNTYQLQNGMTIDFFHANRNHLELRDSIKKNANTFIYRVYRKGKAEYHFLLNLDFNDAYGNN